MPALSHIMLFPVADEVAADRVADHLDRGGVGKLVPEHAEVAVDLVVRGREAARVKADAFRFPRRCVPSRTLKTGDSNSVKIPLTNERYASPG
jgi:hypothetical protein